MFNSFDRKLKVPRGTPFCRAGQVVYVSIFPLAGKRVGRSNRLIAGGPLSLLETVINNNDHQKKSDHYYYRKSVLSLSLRSS